MTATPVLPRTARQSVLVSAADARDAAGERIIVEATRLPLAPGTARIADARVAVLTPDLAGESSTEGGRFPLPDAELLAATLADWGIRSDTRVIVAASTPEDATIATRAWFVLRWAGVRDVRVLDGGKAAWVAAGGDLDSEDGGYERSADAEPRTGPEVGWHAGSDTASPRSSGAASVLDADAALAVAASGVLLDARPSSAFGAGRIPGAVSAPGGSVFEDGRLRPDEELTEWAAGLGLAPGAEAAAYCGGGVAASATVFALASLGIDAGLYVGSWSAWSADPERPIER